MSDIGTDIVELGADINKENKYHGTTLSYACKSEKGALIKYLVGLGTNIKNGNEALVKYLI
ncbi:hypothetical protein H8356DRAFT_1340509 [Neocallimastix lanati (nom. inval.)]|nr:hypothetical protein H8356DRAFT_1340509 [Neocallimastix sp. JGI-2020a]